MFPFFLLGQTYQDKVVLTNGKSYSVQVTKLSDTFVRINYEKGTSAFTLKDVDSLSIDPIGLVFTRKKGFLIHPAILRLSTTEIVKNKETKISKADAIKRVFSQTIHLKNGKKVSGQLLRITDDFLITEIQTKSNHINYQSFAKDSVISIEDKSGSMLFINGKQVKKKLAKFYNPLYKPDTNKYRSVSAYPRLGIAFSFSSTLTQLDILERHALNLFEEYEKEDLSAPEIEDNYFGIDLALLIDISRFMSLSFSGKFDFTSSGENNYYRLVLIDFKWFISESKFRPWIGVGYATLSISQYKDISEGTYYRFKVNPSSPLIGFGFELNIKYGLNFTGAYRFIPFTKEKISFTQVENLEKEINLQAHHISIGFNFKY